MNNTRTIDGEHTWAYTRWIFPVLFMAFFASTRILSHSDQFVHLDPTSHRYDRGSGALVMRHARMLMCLVLTRKGIITVLLRLSRSLPREGRNV
jgi:hypothetical protein